MTAVRLSRVLHARICEEGAARHTFLGTLTEYTLRALVDVSVVLCLATHTLRKIADLFDAEVSAAFGAYQFFIRFGKSTIALPRANGVVRLYIIKAKQVYYK